MKKLSPKRFLTLLPLVFITSCGYSLSYVVKGNQYNSPIFNNNFYRVWNSELKNASVQSERTLASNEFITKFSDLKEYDPYMALEPYDTADDFGKDHRLINYDNSFNYGVQSKLFDGQVQCLQMYQLSRVQVDSNGFSVRFTKEGHNIKYLAMQFKTTTDNTVECFNLNEDKEHNEPHKQADTALYHSSTLTLTTTLYVKDDSNKINAKKYTSEIINDRTNNGGAYIFYAFSLKDEDVDRLVGFSITYTVDDELINHNHNQGIDNISYAIFLYEVFLPYSTWN